MYDKPSLSNYFDSDPDEAIVSIFGRTPQSNQMELERKVIEMPAIDIPVDRLPTQPKTVTPAEPPGPKETAKKGLWEGLSLQSKERFALGAFALSRGLDIFGTVKAGFDAEEEGEEAARHLESGARALRERYQRIGREVLREEASNQAQDQIALSAAGLNFGASQQRSGQAFQQIQDFSQAGADARYEAILKEGESLAQHRLHQANVARKQGQRAKERGILSGVGKLAGTAAGLYFTGGSPFGPAVGEKAGSEIAKVLT